MKNHVVHISLFSAFILSFVLGQINAQNSVVVTATAEIVKPLSIEKLSDLSFGFILVDSDGGTATFDPDGNIVLTGGLVFINGGINPIQASFQISGRPETGINIELPQEVTLLHSDGYEMVLDNFYSDSGSNPVLDAQGKLDFILYSTLNVSSSQESGSYSASFPVIITYD
ncbi:MAG: DUF4402 domain-containing protein [Saprospirales bacterium]|nr:MAG: DUF4402 domain-containing protein [Saprospirales bacterium]